MHDSVTPLCASKLFVKQLDDPVSLFGYEAESNHHELRIRIVLQNELFSSCFCSCRKENCLSKSSFTIKKTEFQKTANS